MSITHCGRQLTAVGLPSLLCEPRRHRFLPLNIYPGCSGLCKCICRVLIRRIRATIGSKCGSKFVSIIPCQSGADWYDCEQPIVKAGKHRLEIPHLDSPCIQRFCPAPDHSSSLICAHHVNGIGMINALQLFLIPPHNEAAQDGHQTFSHNTTSAKAKCSNSVVYVTISRPECPDQTPAVYSLQIHIDLGGGVALRVAWMIP